MIEKEKWRGEKRQEVRKRIRKNKNGSHGYDEDISWEENQSARKRNKSDWQTKIMARGGGKGYKGRREGARGVIWSPSIKLSSH